MADTSVPTQFPPPPGGRVGQWSYSYGKQTLTAPPPFSPPIAPTSPPITGCACRNTLRRLRSSLSALPIRGPFTPDFVKKEGSKSGGYDPFVTKIRKKSVMVTCPGLLTSGWIPAQALKELGV